MEVLLGECGASVEALDGGVGGGRLAAGRGGGGGGRVRAVALAPMRILNRYLTLINIEFGTLGTCTLGSPLNQVAKIP